MIFFPHELHMKSVGTIIQGLRVDLEDYEQFINYWKYNWELK